MPLRMKFLYSTYIIFLFASCENSIIRSKPTQERGFKSISNFYHLDRVSVPIDYDTSFSWLNITGCRYSEELYFRFQTKKLKVLREKCGDDSPYPLSLDTVDRITLTYAKYPNHPTYPDSLWFYQYHYTKIEESKISGPPKNFEIPYDTVEAINGKLFSLILFTYTNAEESVFSKKFTASTIAGNNLTSFSYEIFANKDDLTNEKFIREAKSYLTRSRMNNGM